MFKGQLSLSDIVDMPYKDLIELRSARLERLREQSKELDAEEKKANNSMQMAENQQI